VQDFGPISLFVEFTKKIKKADACSLSPFLYTNLRVMRLWNEAGFRLKFICVTIFFGTAALGHASGCQKGAADEPFRGCLTYKP